jgi:hydroxybutyrate-dimer hydrolase
MEKGDDMKRASERTIARKLGLSAAALVLGACASIGKTRDLNHRPANLGPISSVAYDGGADDLLTAGLGKSGLALAAPAFADPNNPTPRELRRNAIHANYRAVLDISANSGYGTLYGPNIDAAGNVTGAEGKIAGIEYMAYLDDGSGNDNPTLMVQVPASFNPASPCIVTGTSSGSRGIYGAIGSSGEWGLKKGCAVAYADKGTGTGLYTFDDDHVNLQNGVRVPRTAAGKNSIFTPQLSDFKRNGFAITSPNRLAFKHAHSQQNPEKDWGRITLKAIEFAYYVLNEQYSEPARGRMRHVPRFTERNTITIASSISNGAGAALLAAEQDTRGLISGVAVTEPQVQPNITTGYTIRQGGVPVSAQGKPLFDYSTYAALYQPCVAGSAGRCGALVAKGLLSGPDLASQQSAASAKLRAYGWLSDSDPLQAVHAGTNILVAATYANAYGKFSVTDNVCGFSFAQTDISGNPVPMTVAQRATIFSTSSGIIGNILYENSEGGPKAYPFGMSPSSTVADQSLDGFLCLRKLATGTDPVGGGALDPVLAAQSARVRSGVKQVLASANLHGKPAIIVHGRSDTLVPVNHASRAYLGLNAKVEGGASKLRYIEVTNSNHFDSFSNAFPTLIVPLHVYLFRALDALYANLKQGAALPPSQVVRTVTRADAGTPITLLNLPPIAPEAAPGNVISVTGTVVNVPN